MKLINHFVKFLVIILALPVMVLLIIEGVCLVFTDTIPATIRRVSLHLRNLG